MRMLQGTRTYDVRAQLSAPNLRHGALVQVAIRTGPTEYLMSVPARSVRWDLEGPILFVIVDAEAEAYLPHRASLRRVEVRGETADRFSSAVKSIRVIASLIRAPSS